MNDLSSRVTALASEIRHDPMSLVQGSHRLLAALMSIAVMVATVVLGVADDDPRAGQVTGSSEHYQDPGFQAQQRLTRIETDLQRGLLELRVRESVDYLSGSGPLILDPAMQLQAQATARSNAVTGREDAALDRNVGMIQAHLPVDEASGEAFLDLWLRSPAHADVILDPGYAFYGVSAAQGDGQVWAVILFSR